LGGQALSTHLHLQHDLPQLPNHPQTRRLEDDWHLAAEISGGEALEITGALGLQAASLLCSTEMEGFPLPVFLEEGGVKKLLAEIWQKSTNVLVGPWADRFCLRIGNLKLSLAEITGISRRVVVSIVRPSVPLRNLREYPFPLK